ncbi:MAG: phosphatase PAP2 family protein [Coriobacteriia bacterium]|nr:phosphatase PAP2 family protein [Coriobacteriia bacterium]MCL2745758.1 phosphatase PAP2 family protein [Coriobacteriia bacterium]MCL2870529.1 phosphatase PAP2 family protein [Coriobacteriia bacterium]
MKAMTDRTRWILIGLCLTVAAGLAGLALTGGTDALDGWVYSSLTHYASNPLTTYFKLVTTAANSLVMIVFAVGAILWALIVKRQIGFYLAGTLAVSALLNVGLKLLIARPRPDAGIALIIESGHSFPSGHAMAATSFYGFLIFMIANSEIKPWMKFSLCSLLVFLIANICLSRVYLGVHFFSDVAAGALISTCLVLTAGYLAKRKGAVFKG